MLLTIFIILAYIFKTMFSLDDESIKEELQIKLGIKKKKRKKKRLEKTDTVYIILWIVGIISIVFLPKFKDSVKYFQRIKNIEKIVCYFSSTVYCVLYGIWLICTRQTKIKMLKKNI